MAKPRILAGNPLVAVAYIRVSTDDQKLGPEAQRAQIEAWAARGGVQVASWHVDQGVCSVEAVRDREALPKAIDALAKHGAGVLVVAKRDRLARDPMITRAIEHDAGRKGSVVISAAGEASGGTGPADVMMRGVVDLFAEYERGLIRSRTKAALGAKTAKGERVGGVPYGFGLAADDVHRIVKNQRTCKPECLGCVHLVPSETERVVMERAREFSAMRCLSLRRISARLAKEGMLSRSGAPFSAVQVRRMLPEILHVRTKRSAKVPPVSRVPVPAPAPISEHVDPVGEISDPEALLALIPSSSEQKQTRTKKKKAKVLE